MYTSGISEIEDVEKLTVIIDHKDGGRSTISGYSPSIHGYIEESTGDRVDGLAWDDPREVSWADFTWYEGHIIFVLDEIEVTHAHPPLFKPRWYHRVPAIMWVISTTYYKLRYLGLVTETRRIGTMLRFEHLLRRQHDD